MKYWIVKCGCGYEKVQMYNIPLSSECPECGPEGDEE